MAFKDDEIMYVLDLYSYTEGDRKEAVTIFNETFQEMDNLEFYDKRGLTISDVSLGNFWKRYNLSANGHGGSRHGLSDDQLRQLRDKHGGDFKKMVADYKFSAKTLKYRCRRLELEVSNVPPAKGNGPVYRYRQVRTGRSRRSAPRHS